MPKVCLVGFERLLSHTGGATGEGAAGAGLDDAERDRAHGERHDQRLNPQEMAYVAGDPAEHRRTDDGNEQRQLKRPVVLELERGDDQRARDDHSGHRKVNGRR